MIRATISTLGLTLLATAPLVAQTTPNALQRALQRAMQRSQAEIARTVDIWEDHSTWQNPWRARSEHYEVRTTRNHADAKNIADGLEVMLGHFQTTIGVELPARRDPMHVFAHPDIGSYNQFADEQGQHHSSFLGSFYAAQHAERPVAAADAGNVTLLRMQLTHSALHQYLDRAFPGTAAPLWVQEGLACYFAAYWDYGWCVTEFEKIRDGNSWVPLRDLLRDGISVAVA